MRPSKILQDIITCHSVNILIVPRTTRSDASMATKYVERQIPKVSDVPVVDPDLGLCAQVAKRLVLGAMPAQLCLNAAFD